jgi:hypothetical protein
MLIVVDSLFFEHSCHHIKIHMESSNVSLVISMESKAKLFLKQLLFYSPKLLP